MFAFITSLLFGNKTSKPASHAVQLGIDVFEDRIVPASVSFTNGVLLVTSDQSTNDFVRITAAGPNKDGSTGVKLYSNINGWQTQTFGDATHPVTNIGLDLKDGNDVVSVASLSSVVTLIGEGNGNNFIHVGAGKDVGVLAGSGQNIISLGGGSDHGFGDGNFPGFSAGAVAFLGWSYAFANGGTAFFGSPNVGNNANNFVHIGTKTGENSIVDIAGNGNNWINVGAGNNGIVVNGSGNNHVFTGNGNDNVIINGGGNNSVSVGRGDDTINITGNGNNRVSDHGSGSVTINGTGKDTVNARCSTSLAIALNGAGVGSRIVASSTDSISVDGNAVTQSGVVDNVHVRIV